MHGSFMLLELNGEVCRERGGGLERQAGVAGWKRGLSARDQGPVKGGQTGSCGVRCRIQRVLGAHSGHFSDEETGTLGRKALMDSQGLRPGGWSQAVGLVGAMPRVPLA